MFYLEHKRDIRSS